MFHHHNLWVTLLIFTLEFVTPNAQGAKKILQDVSSDIELQLQAQVRKLDLELEKSFTAPENPSSSCSCYAVQNPFMNGQALCLCKNLCSVGGKLNFLSAVECEPESAAVAGGPLTHISCKDEKKFSQAIDQIAQESLHHPWEYKPQEWIRSRKSVTWRPGLTYFQPLTRDTTNIAHLIGKVMQILLVNNCTVDALIPKVDRIMLPRSIDVLYRMKAQGPSGFHPTLLASILGTSLAPILSESILRSKQIRPQALYTNETAAFGRIEFESVVSNSTESEPLCFERVAMAGVIRAISFIGGAKVGTKFSSKLHSMLGLKPQISQNRVRLVWLRRESKHGRRQFTSYALEMMREMIGGLNLEVREVQFDGMPFVEQIRHTIEADILLSIHGAGLTIPSTFGRHKAIIFEIMPYFANHEMYKMKALASGITYMSYQCHKGPSQKGDKPYEELTIPECMLKSPKCKHHFLHTRKLDLVQEDVQGIRRLLLIAKEFILKARESTKTSALYLRKVYRDNCESFSIKERCRASLIQSPLVDIHKSCLVEFECGNV